MITRGSPWGEPTSGAPEIVVVGSDGDLARAALEHPGRLVAFRPDGPSDLARAVGLGASRGPGDDPAGEERGGAAGTAVPFDLLVVDGETPAVNAVVVGTPPSRMGWNRRSYRSVVAVDGVEVHRGRASAVVVANGQFVDGADTVPRGHPGDGRLEVQVYRGVRRREARELRRRVTTGNHLPHPGILQRHGHRVTIDTSTRAPVLVDGTPVALGRRGHLEVELRPDAFRLLVPGPPVPPAATLPAP